MSGILNWKTKLLGTEGPIKLFPLIIEYIEDAEFVELNIPYVVPVDEELMFASASKHGKCLVLTEEPVFNGFAQSIAARISENCFKKLDAPIRVIGAENLPAIPLNSTLEKTMLPNADKVEKALEDLLNY